MKPHLALAGLLVLAAASLPVAAVAAGQQQPRAAFQSDQATAAQQSLDSTTPTNARPGGSTSPLASLLEKLTSFSASSDEIVAALREEARRNPGAAHLYEDFLAGEPGTSFKAGRTGDGKPTVYKTSANGALMSAVGAGY